MTLVTPFRYRVGRRPARGSDPSLARHPVVLVTVTVVELVPPGPVAVRT